MIFIFVITFISIFLFSERKEDINVDVTLDKMMNKNELKILISPYREIQCGYESSQYFNELNSFVVLFKNGQMQNYQYQGIIAVPKYYIYAKYKNRYARVKYENTLFLGQDKTEIRLFFNPNSINGKVFKDKVAFSQNKYDMQLLSHLDQL